MSADELKSLLERALPGSSVIVEDLTGGGDHYRVDVVSARFRGKTRIEQHRMVYAAVGDRLTREIHALTVRTGLPDQGA